MGITLDLIRSLGSKDYVQDKWAHIRLLVSIWIHHVIQKTFLGLYRGELRWSGERIESEDLEVFGGSGRPIAVVPLLSHDSPANRAVVHATVRIIREVLGTPIRVLAPRYIDGDRLNGDEALDRFSDDHFLSSYTCVLILTDVDMFSSGHRWVYGYAGLRVPCCAVSTYRLGFGNHDEPREISLESWRRLVRVIVHELGHTYGLPHCPYDSCIMHDVPDEGVIKLPLHFCASCRTTILHSQR